MAAVTLPQLQELLAPLILGLAALDSKVSALDTKVTILDTKVTALDTKVAALDTKVTALDNKVTALDNKVTTLSAKVDRLEAARSNDAVRAANRLKSLTAPLVPLRFNAVGADWPGDIEQPETLLSLAVSGAESVPGGTTRSGWNRIKSRAFLRAAVEGYTDDGTDAEGELGAKSRTVRLKVIEAIGGVYERVISTLHTLN
jgi:outer membrane murein-binding lipoprotein Lpp